MDNWTNGHFQVDSIHGSLLSGQLECEPRMTPTHAAGAEWGRGRRRGLVTCDGATPSLALRINSLMLIPAPLLVPGLVGVP